MAPIAQRDRDAAPDAAEASRILNELSSFGPVLAVKLYRLTLNPAPGIPTLPCLDHEAMLHEEVAPHLAAYLQDGASGDLHEVVEASDRVVVLRDGKMVGVIEGEDINHDAMVRLMVGRELKVDYVPPSMTAGNVVLSVKNLRTSTYPGREINLDLRAGEILGLAGLVGAG